MLETQREVESALKSNAGPYFLGPRLEFDYAALGVPSPAGLPVYWQPGTSFPSYEETELIANWEARGFETVIFLKKDTAYYSPQFLT